MTIYADDHLFEITSSNATLILWLPLFYLHLCARMTPAMWLLFLALWFDIEVLSFRLKFFFETEVQQRQSLVLLWVSLAICLLSWGAVVWSSIEIDS